MEKSKYPNCYWACKKHEDNKYSLVLFADIDNNKVLKKYLNKIDD